jgi:hypothetical protein
MSEVLPREATSSQPQDLFAEWAGCPSLSSSVKIAGSWTGRGTWGDTSMSIAYSEYAQICQQVKHWPTELRQDLAEEIAKSLAADLPAASGEWTADKNERRCELIDKDIQGAIGPGERRELEVLTQQMRAYRRTIARIPLEGAARLHQQLLERKQQQMKYGEAQ